MSSVRTSENGSTSMIGSNPSTNPPLALPVQLNRNTFYISPIANPDLVVAIIIPTHPLYSGHDIPATVGEQQLSAAAAAAESQSQPSKFGSSIASFFGTAANTVTNTAANTIGIKNQFELNKPRLKLVPRSSQSGAASANQRWIVNKEDGCIYSCVEEKEGSGTYYKLGLTKNRMMRVKSKDVGASHEGSSLGVPKANSITTTSSSDSMASSQQNSYAPVSPSPSSNSKMSGLLESPAAGMLSVTTAKGNTIFVPRQWEAHKYIQGEELRSLISINSIHVVIEETDASNGGVGFSRASSLSSDRKDGSSTPHSSGGRILCIKNICCGNLHCELEKIDVGSPCGFRSETSKDAEVTMDMSVSTPSSRSFSGPNVKQVWRIESDFSIWLSTLSRSVATEYTLTRKLQKVEEQRRMIRENTPTPESPIPMKLTIDYDYTLVWSTEGTKASIECSIWRPRFPPGSHHVYFGDYVHPSLKPPTKKESLVVSSSINGALHRGVIRPVDFELVWSKNKGKHGYLYVWEPIGPKGVDAVSLGHVVTCGKKEEKPSIQCGVVLVLRDYVQDTGHALHTPLWTDANVGGSGPIGSFWSAKGVHTFFCNPGTHSPPTGTYYTLLSPESLPEQCPLLRPVETSNAGWESVWDDRGTLAKMDVSVWRPSLSDRAFVRFGDMVVRGHQPPKNLAVVAKDHPAFKRPLGYTRLTKLYRGARKCHVWLPLVPDANYVALGYVITPTKEEPPSRDCIRCVHKEALIPLGILKQMWIEHHSGMMSTLTLGMTNFINLSKEGVVNMLWKNRSLNTFMICQNTHARPDNMAYRLSMTASELQLTVSRLEIHARWVLESFYQSLQAVVNVLVESGYKRLTISPSQLATIFQSIRGIYKYLHDADGDASAFTLSSECKEYLRVYQDERLRAIYAPVKRYLFETICADISDHDTTLEVLDDSWPLLQQMPDVHKTQDRTEEWQPPLTTRFPATNMKSLVSILMDDYIGKEIFERFLEKFPPRLTAGMPLSDEDNDDDEEATKPSLTHLASTSNGHAGVSSPTDDSPTTTSATASPNGDGSKSQQTQLAETKTILDQLSTFSADLDAVISITDHLEIRKLYLERYSHYLTHTITQEFPVTGDSARSGRTKAKLGMSSILAIVGWINDYIELVEMDLLDGDHEEARIVLEKMESLQDRFMDCHDMYAQEKILTWISNILRQEERTTVELLQGESSRDGGGGSAKYYYFTSGPSDLFLNINTLFDSQSANLTGRPLARIGLMYVHVLTYYQQVQCEYFKHLRAIRDDTSHETAKGAAGRNVSATQHAGSLDKPYAYILGQINNARLYQSNVDELGEKVLIRLNGDGASDEIIASIEDAFAQCNEEFSTLGLGATEVLIRHIATRLEAPFLQMFTEKVWYADAEYFQTAILDELDDLCSCFVPNLEQGLYSTHLLRESIRNLITRYIRAFMTLKVSNTMTGAAVAERIRDERIAIEEYCRSIKGWDIMEVVDKPLKQLDLFADFLSADADFLKLKVDEIPKAFRTSNPSSSTSSKSIDPNALTAGIMTAHLLSLRNDISSEDRKLWLAPYAAELKAIEEARKQAASNASTNKLSHILSSKKAVQPTPQAILAAHGGIGTTLYGLEIFLHRGMDLVIKDTTTSDPYVNILLLNSNGDRLDKMHSKTIDKTLNPIWNETFTKFRPADVIHLHRIRFEVWDKDFVGKDFMGAAEVTVEEIRNKQLLERKSAVSRTSVTEDYTQEAIPFHLKLQPREGRQNIGSDKVSGYIDVRIKYFKLGGGGGGDVSAPVPSKSGRSSMPPSGDDELDFGIEETGQTGSKRAPLPEAVPKSAMNPTSVASSPEPFGNGLAPSPSNELEDDADRSSAHLLKQLEMDGPKFTDIVQHSGLKLGRSAASSKSSSTSSSSSTGTGVSTASAAHSPRKSQLLTRTKTQLKLTKGVPINVDARAQTPAETTEPRKPKLIKKKDSYLDFFGLL